MNRKREHEEEEIYVEGWKISRIIHMFTQPLKPSKGGPHQDRTDKGSTAKNTTFRPSERARVCERMIASGTPFKDRRLP